MARTTQKGRGMIVIWILLAFLFGCWVGLTCDYVRKELPARLVKKDAESVDWYAEQDKVVPFRKPHRSRPL